MKNLTAFLLISVLLFGACKNNSSGTDGAEKKDNKETKLSPEAEHDLKLYKQAIDRLDLNTAVVSLNSYLMRDTSAGSLRYKDTLAQLYLEQQQMPSLLKVAEEILEKRPNDTAILKMHVFAAENTGRMEMAINSTRKLYEIFNTDLNYKFYYGKALVHDMATAQEGVKLLLEIANDPQAAKIQTSYTDYTTGKVGQVSLNTSAYMLLGQMEAQLGNFDKAEQYFVQATKGKQFAPAAEAILEVRRMKRMSGGQ